ncbi:MAG TPA: amylo-alpha-1,6-glucosidase [Polyangiaceae bacterium]|nr:amylo-alpha-1,6-glucosidase [Polyangiaceae bacterium]
MPPLEEIAREEDPTSPLVTREWLVTNGLGGYASGAVATLATRRYHGLLVAALPAPLGRTMLIAHLTEVVRMPGGRAAPLAGKLTEFRLELGLPVWRYEVEGFVIERRVWMAHGSNTVFSSYALVGGNTAIEMELEPWIRFRPHDGALDLPLGGPYALQVVDDRYEIASEGYPPLRMGLDGGQHTFTMDRKRLGDVRYLLERARGYESVGELHSPGFFRIGLAPGATVTFFGSSEPWTALAPAVRTHARSTEETRRRQLLAAAHPAAREGLAAHLVIAADQFLVAPAARADDAATRHDSRSAGTVIAGYHWFTDWGRDTMISLEGLTLVTGRSIEARTILRTFADAVRDGLIPNLYPEHGSEGLYHTADATLWFFHAIDRYVSITGDRETLRLLLPRLVEIIDRHVAGTRFSIGVAPDGLLSQGASGYALTWMDAKVGDLVVTPRRGKAVEINALWYNALRLIARWLDEERGDEAGAAYRARAQRAYDAFNERFWYEAGGYLYDVIDGESGDDPSFRPNQLLAVSLPHAVLDPSRWGNVLDQVQSQLLSPFGLRSLAPGEPRYQAKYFGPLRARDLAYHQGTVWAWLVGPFIDASMKVRGHAGPARELLEAFARHLGEAGVGSISEIFDAETPFTPRGCIAQAWSVAEVLRCLVLTSSAPP